MLEVIFPMAKPSIITVILFNFLSFWNEYIIIKTLVTDKNQWTLPAGLLNLMQAQQSAAEYGPMYAGLVLVMLPVLILLFFVVGMVLTIADWKMTGKLEGLGLILVGIVLLLTALFVYNAAYKN